jgi:hypothetical protein
MVMACSDGIDHTSGTISASQIPSNGLARVRYFVGAVRSVFSRREALHRRIVQIDHRQNKKVESEPSQEFMDSRVWTPESLARMANQ